MRKTKTPFSRISFYFFMTFMLVTLFILTSCQSKPNTENSDSKEPASNQISADKASGTSEEATVTSQEVTLTISAAASMTEALSEIKTLYETKFLGNTLLLNFASSGSLEQQIEQGADVDVFLSASPKYTNLLKEKSLIIDDSLVNLLKNEIVLVTHLNSPLNALEFDALDTADYDKIGIGQPESVPAGQYAEEILTTLGIKDAVYTHAVFAKDVKEVLTWVETDNADLGIVYSTDAANSKSVKILSNAPADSHKTIIYPAVVIKETKHIAEATEFLNFLSEQDTMNVFLKYGFLSAQ
ncbi:molybdate ABC transporter substrate-binding protein [Fusibacter ferrireducens]|uniref:Molybdate ABC transporter substrate-binding protein n=1 Tax=Fusibacter ferrireducens TaxID=2785058 RepID=A0ABR9ZR61_9FIRM|nr:molybdate ABC transporter substrate-binding protein [Fusibacter ferrireducens]MBF4692643.1 molybdate ABC transporter substrate-binding protein [Fusibacter ferrireducens]